MKVKLARIGNSRGIRIPKPLIEQCGFGDVVELHIERNRLVISPLRPPREDWRKFFAAAGSIRDEDPLLLARMPQNAFDAKGMELVNFPRRGRFARCGANAKGGPAKPGQTHPASRRSSDLRPAHRR